MEPSDFQNLIEIQSLELKIEESLKFIASEQDRIKYIDSLREDKETFITSSTDKLNTLKEELKQDEKLLHDTEAKIEKAKEHAKVATTQAQIDATENEQKTLMPKAEELENLILEKLELIDETQKEIEESEEFLKNSKIERSNISNEVSSKVNREEGEIGNFRERIENLLSISDKEAQEAWKSVYKRFKGKSPLAFVQNDTCNRCKYSIRKTLSQAVDKANVIEYCPGCGRLLVPSKP